MTDRIPRPESVRAAMPATVFLGAAAIACVAYLLLAPLPTVQDWLYDAVGLAAVLAILAGIRYQRPRHRLPWLLVAAGTALFVAGDVAWSVLSLLGESPFPSVADVAYVLGYPVLMLAFLAIIAIRVGDGDRSGLLDAAILAIAVGLVGWVTMLRPVLDAPGDPLALAISVAYPLGDLLIIGVAIGMLATPGRRGAAFALLVGFLLVQFAGDFVYAVQVADGTAGDGGVLDLTWIAAYAMTGAAALHPSMRGVAEPNPVHIARLSRTRLAFMSLAMVTGPVLMLMHEDRDIGLLVAGTIGLSVMVVVRMGLIARTLAGDIVARASLEDELGYRASHDPLTGLANRRRFLEELETAVTELAGAPVEERQPLCVLFLDLDDFKGINDTLGHATGDALLTTVARRIRSQLRTADVASRMGGDEFGAVLRMDGLAANRIARRILDAFREPIAIGDHTVTARGSIGIAEAGETATVEGLLADADIAMYRAKAQGKNTVCIYAPELREDVIDRMQLESDLRAAVAHGQLALEFQPIVDLGSRRTVGVEALVRWTHTTRGAVAPSVFIPLADASGLGSALGTWVLESACARVAAWRRTIAPGLDLAVNLAPRQLAGTDLVAVVYCAAERAGLPLDALIVDVTEGALLLAAPEVAANLAALRALGVRVAIDDFGTGYSSLGNLGRLPVDILKIDRSFIDRLGGTDDRGIAAVVVGLGETLGLETIAEGIERPEQVDAVRSLGCHLGQGYHLAPPMSAAEFEAHQASAARVASPPGPSMTVRTRVPLRSAAGA